MRHHGTILGAPWFPDPASGGSSARGPHRMAAAQRCQVQWDLRYRRGIRISREPPWRLSGSLWHLYNAYWWAERMDVKPEWWAPDGLEEEEHVIAKGRDEEVSKSRAMFDAFILQAKTYDWTPVGVEIEVFATLGEIFKAAGQDLPEQWEIYRNEIVTAREDLVAIGGKSTRGLVCDYKSKGARGPRLGEFKESEFSLDWQIMVGLTISRVHFQREGLSIGPFLILHGKREPPYHFRRVIVKPPTLPYQNIPTLLGFAIQREHEIMARKAEGLPVLQDGIIHGACGSGAWACDYVDICAVNTIADRKARIERSFEQ